LKVLIDELSIADHYEERNLNNRKEDLDAAITYLIYWQERQQSIGEEYTAESFLKWLKIRDIQEKLMDDRDCVKLMTIHGSKGLEFETVFVIGMNEGTFPNSKASTDMEEERRLAYVAVTRAKSHLIVSSTRVYISPWGKEQMMEPSRFLQEMKGSGKQCLTG
jgi:DNA helicase-2/ATP-dependent DNA helicase PcrA